MPSSKGLPDGICISCIGMRGLFFFFSLKATDTTWEAQAEGRAQKLQADEDGIRTQRTMD